MNNKTIVITGASDGIGAAAARQLRAMDFTVVVVGRSPEKTKLVADELHASYYVADFTRLSDVRKLAGKLNRDLPRIDVLANNAGGIFGKREVTVDGHEKTMQVNHLASFLLTNLLMEKLLASKASIINTSSFAHKAYSKFDINDIEVTKNYTQKIAYGNSKLENILFTKELHERFNKDGISSAAFHPGNVATNFANGTNSLIRYAYHTPLSNLLLIPPELAANMLVWLATTIPGEDWQSGEYYEKHHISKRIDKKANDSDLAFQLWEQSAKLIAD
jgi:NAD(P)-dependent dehydrogenase (short-subunit alcohol dehydrogenase family)